MKAEHEGEADTNTTSCCSRSTFSVVTSTREAHVVSIRKIERLTELDLPPRVDGAALKEAVASELWPRN